MSAVRRTLAAWALCALLVAGTLFSEWFLVREIRHTCTGANCPTCACLQLAARQLKTGARPSVRTAVRAAAAFAAATALSGAVCTLPGATLVARKIRLDN